MPEPDVKVDLKDDVIAGAVRTVYQNFRVALPALAQTFARETSRAAVAFGTRWLGLDRKVYEEPPVADLPVLLPRCGGYGFYADMRAGDLGLVVACDGPVRGLYETGEPVTPQFPQAHDFGCAVVLPGGRVSSTETPTAPPNDAGTLLIGADDGTAAVVFRGAGLPDPAELGSVVVAAAGPTASVLLGGTAAVLGVARQTDPVDRNALLTTWMSQVTAAINAIVPGSVTPFVTPTIGTISGASAKVVAE